MSNTAIGKIIIISLILILIGIFIVTEFAASRVVRYDCRDAHWHPDVPIEVKKQCQELMRQQMEKPKLII